MTLLDSIVLQHLTSEAVRYVVIVDLFVLLVVGALIRRAYRAHVPPELDVLVLLFGSVLVAVAVAIVVNLVSPVPPTPGVKGLALVLTPLTGAVLYVTGRSVTVRR